MSNAKVLEHDAQACVSSVHVTRMNLMLDLNGILSEELCSR